MTSRIVNQCEAGKGHLLVAWFGHKSRTRGDGLITYSEEMTNGLRQRGLRVIVFFHGREERDGLEAEDNVRIGSFNILNRDVVSAPDALSVIERRLRQEKPDVAHVSLAFSQLDFSLPELCHSLGIPVVATLHFPYDRRTSFWGILATAMYRLYSLSLSRYDAIIIFSEEQRQLLAGFGVPIERIHVIPNGVDTSRWSPGPSDYKTQVGADCLIAFCGRLDPEKNVGALLEAFERMNPPPGCKLVVVGDGVMAPLLRSRYADNSNIIFTGLIAEETERVRILRAADIFVLPSEVEGLSLSMLEAMSTGLATVATDVGGDSEALRGAGILIEPRHLDVQLPLALQILLDFPEFRLLLGQRARQRATEYYDLNKNIDRVVNLYQDLVVEYRKGEN